MIRFFIAIIVLVGVMWFVARLGRVSPVQRTKYMKLAALYIAGAILLFLVFTGRLHALFALAAVAIPWIQRIIMLRSAYNMFKSWTGPVQGAKPGQTSDVRTKYFEMTLNHDTGDVTGTVLTGKYQGQTLDSLSIEELAELLQECNRRDEQSASILETYLDRMRTDEWEEYVNTHTESEAPEGASSDMSYAEALQVLGLEEGATREEIIEAHRVMMQRNHPDRGGSTWVSARINQAKNILLS